MFRRKRRLDEKPAIELVEEAFQLLRRAPTGALAAYFVGSLPFVLGLLYFWSDMARSAFAEERLLTGSLAMTLLFIWMKTWQSLYAHQLLKRLCGEPAPRWSLKRFLRTAVYQSIVQPAGLLILPIALPLIVPFGWIYAFFTNGTVFAAGEAPDIKSLARKSWQQARLWPMQSQYVIFSFKFFGFFVFLNLFALVYVIPFLMKSLLGIETMIMRSPEAVFNTTVLAGVAAVTWLCVDPVVKAAFVLRCFYGESLSTGQDLRAELKSVSSPARAAAVLLALALGLGSPTSGFGNWLGSTGHWPVPSGGPPDGTGRASPANHDGLLVGAAAPVPVGGSPTGAGQWPAPPSFKARYQSLWAAVGEEPSPTGNRQSAIPPKDLDRSIDEVIQKREYSWRLPREAAPKKEPKEGSKSWISELFESLGTGLKTVFTWVKDFIEWMEKQSSRPKTPGIGGFHLGAAIKPLLFVLIVALIGVVAWLIVRVWKRRGPAEEIVAEATASVPNVADENVGADQLPDESWVRLARELLERGELRLALRAFYLASLAALAARNLITLAKFKSNRDYERELLRRSHALQEVPRVFSENVSVFERVWYGLHEVTPQMLDQFSGNVQRIQTGS